MATEVVLKIPSEGKYLTTVRLTTSSMASLCGLDLESVEDIRVATSEACNILMGQGEIYIEYYTGDEELEIKVGLRSGKISYSDEVVEEMAKQIMSVLVDDVNFDDSYISFAKRKKIDKNDG